MTTKISLSPLGLIRIVGNDAGVSIISCTNVPVDERIGDATLGNRIPEPVQQATDQLAAYFAGTRQTFDFPMTPAGTAFQQAVWRALLTVPFGTTLGSCQHSGKMFHQRVISL